MLSNGARLNEKTRPMQSTAPKQYITRLQKLYTVNIYIILYLKFELSNEKARFVPREYKINYDITLYVVTLRAGVPFDCSPGNMGWNIIRVNHARQHARLMRENGGEISYC